MGAQSLCWVTVMTERQIYSAFEESIWVFMFTFYLYVALKLYNATGNNMYLFLVASFVIYLMFMIAIDVPLYYNGYYEDLKGGKKFMDFFEGLARSYTCGE